MRKKLFLIALIAGFTFTSCEKCKDCEYKYEFINNDSIQPLYELAAMFNNYNSWDEMWNSDDSIQALNKEYCDDELSDVLFVLLCLANQTGVDLQKSFDKRLDQKAKRDHDRHHSNPKLG